MSSKQITKPQSKAAPDVPDLDEVFKSIPVGILSFTEVQDGPGLKVNSSLTSMDQRKNGSLIPGKKHTIVFIPQLGCFRIKHYKSRDSKAETFMIGQHRVSYWVALNE